MTSRHAAAATLMLLACTPALRAAAPTPWSFHDEVYHIYASSLNLHEMHSAGITLLSHVPARKDYFEKAHALGIRVLPYISLYKCVDLSQWPEGKVHPFWRELDLVKHPGWVLIRPDGKLRRPFNNPNYRRGAYQSCCNAPGIHEAYVRGVKGLMELGADGVFVDNVHPWPKCRGVELGIPGHTHMQPDKSNQQMFKLALAKVYQAVKSYGQDKVVILNGGRAYGDCGDALMWESYVCSHGTIERRPGWGGVLSSAHRWADYLASGKGVAALCYLWKSHWGQLDDAHYSFACTKLSGYHWTSSSGHWHASLYPHFGPGATDWSATTCRNDVLRLLYRVRLGKPLGPIAEADGITCRLFERGLVAVNPARRPLTARLPVPPQCPQPADLYTGALLPRQGKTFRITILPESGRVVIDRRAMAESFLEEVRLSASELIRRHAEVGEARAHTPLATLRQLEELSEEAKRSAGDYAKAVRIVARALPLVDALRPPAKPEAPPPHPFNPETTVAQHIENLRRHAATSLGILGGIELRAECPRNIVAGASEAIRLRLLAHDEKLAADPPTFRLTLPEGWTASGSEGTFRVTAPGSAKGRHFFAAWADAKLADGTPIRLYTDLQAVIRAAVEIAGVAAGTRPGGQAELRVALRSYLPSPVKADLAVTLPKGWKGQTAAHGIPLPAHGAKSVALPVQPPADATGKQATIRATVAVGRPTAKSSTTHRVLLAPMIVAARAAKPPKLDGALDDPCWKNAEPVSGFVHFETATPITEQTIVRAAWDDQHLYVAFDCRESQPKAIRTRVRPGAAGGSVLQDDCVAVYLDPGLTRRSCLRCFVNSLGARTDYADIGFDGGAARRADGWGVELRFPFARLRRSPNAGDIWGINFYRNEWRLREHSAWSCTHGPYSTPQRFGILVFGDNR